MRRVVIILGGLLAAGLIALAVLPWWLSPVLKLAGRRYGAEFTRYERLSYARFAVHGITVTRANTVVKTDRVEAETPLVWLFHRWSGRPAPLVARSWSVEITKTNAAPLQPSAGGAMKTRALLFKVAEGLERWLPFAEVGAGVVKWPGGELRFDSATWKRDTLVAQAVRYGTQAAHVAATFTKDEIQIAVQPATDAPWKVTLLSRRAEITGELRAWEQIAPVFLKLPESGWMPTEARVQAERWSIPATQLKLGPGYATVRGEARLEWREEKFEASADLAGETVPDKKAPPLAVKLHASGSREAVTVDSVLVNIPGAKATLSAPIVLDRQGRMPAGASNFALEIDLEKFPWSPEAKGKIAGQAQVISRNAGTPHLEAKFEAADVSIRDWAVARFTAAVSGDWPRLQVNEATLGFAEGGQLNLRGGWDFQTREFLAVTLEGSVQPSVLGPWLPPSVKFGSATVNGKVEGKVDALRHEGMIQIASLEITPLNPLAVNAAWRGTGAVVEISEVRAEAGASRLRLSGTAEPGTARVTSLHFEQAGTERLTLAEPAVVRWSPRWELETLRLTGGDASITASLQIGESGRLEAAVRNFSSAWLVDFVAMPGPEWQILSGDAQGKWDNGPATFSARTEVAVTLAPGRLASVSLALSGDAGGTKIESWRVLEGAEPIVNASGQLPLTLHPHQVPKVQFAREAALTLQATTTSNPVFWKKFTEATGLEVQGPEVKVNLNGTWARPQGEISAKAERIAADPQRIAFPFPAIEALDAVARIDNAGLLLERLTVRVEGQAVRASGKLPFTPERWADFRREPVAFIRRDGSLRLEIPDAEVAALARYTGRYLAPAGRLHVDVTLAPGGEMAGTLRLEEAATRPLGPLGVLQDVEVDARLNGRSVELTNVSARSGGEPVKLTGSVQLPVNSAPKYDLALTGENLPLVRQTGFLMRADLNLKLFTGGDDKTAVTGNVRLRDSMFLSDVRALIPRGGGGGPARRPPFFAVEIPPLNEWRLGVEVSGDQFLRLRSTVFVGVASAHFNLGGTLGEPRAVGEVVVDSGQVLLPFATFRVEQGTVRLTEADPYSLQLFLTGASRRYGYDLRLELTGTATEPLLTFSSSPPLEAEQVLLMVTAGELPRNEITYVGAQRVARLGTYLGQSLINNFGGDAADADRLSISTGERVSRKGKETYDVQYRMNDRLTFVGEIDEFDAYNAGVKWRLLKSKSEAEKRAASAEPQEKKEPIDATR